MVECEEHVFLRRGLGIVASPSANNSNYLMNVNYNGNVNYNNYNNSNYGFRPLASKKTMVISTKVNN